MVLRWLHHLPRVQAWSQQKPSPGLWKTFQQGYPTVQKGRERSWHPKAQYMSVTKEKYQITKKYEKTPSFYITLQINVSTKARPKMKATWQGNRATGHSERMPCANKRQTIQPRSTNPSLSVAMPQQVEMQNGETEAPKAQPWKPKGFCLWMRLWRVSQKR